MKPINYMIAAEKATPKFTKNGGFLTVKLGDTLNVMTISWWTIGFIWQRPILTVAVRPTRHTFGLIEKADDFALSIPIPDLPEKLSLCGSKSGRDFNKFVAANLSTIAAQHVNSPVINVPGIHYECKIVLRSQMDPTKMSEKLEHFYPQKDYHTMYFGEIVACYEL